MRSMLYNLVNTTRLKDPRLFNFAHGAFHSRNEISLLTDLLDTLPKSG
jgi:hypothetical protein